LEKGSISINTLSNDSVSLISLVCLGIAISLFYSPEFYLIEVKSCIAWLTWPHAGIDNSQIVCCCSIIPRPVVKPPLVLRLLINTCSITRSVDNPAHARLLWRIVWYLISHSCYGQLQPSRASFVIVHEGVSPNESELQGYF
jgi:hypothetical protein